MRIQVILITCLVVAVNLGKPERQAIPKFIKKLQEMSFYLVLCDRTKMKIYENVNGNMCFRRLNATHQTGCSCKLTFQL